MHFSYTKTDGGTESLLLYGDGINTVVPGSHPHFSHLRDYLRDAEEIDVRHVRALVEVGQTVSSKLRRLSERASFDGAHIRFDGDVIDTNLSRHIVRMLREGDESYARFVAFMENLATNPSKTSRMHLFTWLDGRDFTITPEGHLLGYKGVQADEDNSSMHEGTATVNGIEYTGHIPNPIGAVVEMPRQQVNPNRDEGCSTGLHVGTHSYAAGFGRRLLKVSVNPRDVVSVPRDCGFAKLRCCRYTVLDVHDQPEPVQTPSYGSDLFPDDEEDWDDDLEEIDAA